MPPPISLEKSYDHSAILSLPSEILDTIVSHLDAENDRLTLQSLRLVDSTFARVTARQLFSRASAWLSWHGILHLEVLANSKFALYVKDVMLICPDGVEHYGAGTHDEDRQMFLRDPKMTLALRSSISRFSNLKSFTYAYDEPETEYPSEELRAVAAQFLAESVCGLRLPRLDSLRFQALDDLSFSQVVDSLSSTEDDRNEWFIRFCGRIQSFEILDHEEPDDFEWSGPEAREAEPWFRDALPLFMNFQALRRLVMISEYKGVFPRIDHGLPWLPHLTVFTLRGYAIRTLVLQDLLRWLEALESIDIADLRLFGPGVWEQVFITLGELKTLKSVSLEGLRYDETAGDFTTGNYMEATWIRHDPGDDFQTFLTGHKAFLYSSRWADAHALRDFLEAAGDKLVESEFAWGSTNTTPQKRAQKLVDHFCSLDEYYKLDPHVSHRKDDAHRAKSEYDPEHKDRPQIF